MSGEKLLCITISKYTKVAGTMGEFRKTSSRPFRICISDCMVD